MVGAVVKIQKIRIGPDTSKVIRAGLLGGVLLVGNAVASELDVQRSLKLKGFGDAPSGYADPDFAEPLEAPIEEERVLPEVPVTSMEQKERLSTTGKIFVERFIIEGNTILSKKDLAAITNQYENRSITTGELQEVRLKLSRLYLGKGYINSGVVIPDQKITDGVVKLQVIEGQLNEIELTGNKFLDDEYITGRIALGVRDPLNILVLQEALKALQKNPRIKKINAQLNPEVKLGESTLSVKVTENSPYVVQMGLDNHRSPSVGGTRGHIYLAHQSVSGNGDTLAAELGATDGNNDYQLSYSVPLTATDAMFEIYLSNSDSVVVEEPFNIIDMESESNLAGISFKYPFIKNPGSSLIGSIGFETKHSESFLLGVPFSFSPGVINGVSDVSAYFLSLDWMNQSSDTVWAIRGTVRVGVDAYGATINANAPDSEFTSFQGQIQYAKRLDTWKSQLIMRSSFQVAGEPLLPTEKFAVGGARSVRGYRENLLVRDNGLVASVEWRIPVAKDGSGGNRNDLQLVPFIDFGKSRDEDKSLPTSETDTLSSAGIGILWRPKKGMFAELYWGSALEDVAGTGTDLQDDGIHFLFSYQFQ